MEETAFVVDVDDLERLEFLCDFTSGNVGVDVEDLAVGSLGKRGEDGYGTGADGGLDGTFVDASDLADETVLVLVEEVGGEDARGNRTGACTELLERTDEAKVLVEEYAASDLQRLCVWSNKHEHDQVRKKPDGEVRMQTSRDKTRG